MNMSVILNFFFLEIALDAQFCTDRDIYMSGYVSWVGKSLMEVFYFIKN